MLYSVAGVTMPKMPSTHNGYVSSITDAESPVKPKFRNVTESQQFKRWFGDWQNDPENASKVVNTDGTPKIMYHGTDAEFTVFDRSKGKKKVHLNVFGDGNYFTAKMQGAKRYRDGAGIVTLRGVCNGCGQFARYKLLFAGNIAVADGGTAEAISVAFSIGGESVPATTATVTPAAVGDLWNVATAAFIDVQRGCCANVAVKNTSGQAIETENANLLIERVA